MHAVAGWVHAVAGWVHTCYMYDCRFGHHHIVDPRTGQLLKCGREAPALAAVEAASCALADALATALLVAGSVAEAADRRWAGALMEGGVWAGRSVHHVHEEVGLDLAQLGLLRHTGGPHAQAPRRVPG